jgi:fatty-acyl-CoA synthase
MLYEVIPEFEKGAFSVPVKSKRFPFLKQILLTDERLAPQEGTVRFKDILVYGPFGYYENPLRRLAMNIDKDTPALILLDGTDPNKATPHVFSHKNLLNAGAALAVKLDLKQGDRVLVPKYLDTPFGSVLGNFAALTSGASLVYPKEEYDASTTAQSIAAEKIAVLFAQASDLQDILASKDINQLDLSSVRAIVTEENLAENLLATVQSTFKNASLIRVNGHSNTSGLITIDGQVVGNNEVKITREADAKIVHRDTFGDLKVRGDFVAKGYWNDIGIMNPDIDEEGWLNTGKVAKISKDGKLQFK